MSSHFDFDDSYLKGAHEKGDWGRSGYFTHHHSQPLTPKAQMRKAWDIKQTCCDKLPALQHKKKIKPFENCPHSLLVASFKDHIKLFAPFSSRKLDKGLMSTWAKWLQSPWVKDIELNVAEGEAQVHSCIQLRCTVCKCVCVWSVYVMQHNMGVWAFVCACCWLNHVCKVSGSKK